MSIIDVLFPCTPPEPKGVTFVQNLMGTKPAPKKRSRLTPEQVRERENIRRRLKNMGRENGN